MGWDRPFTSHLPEGGQIGWVADRWSVRGILTFVFLH